MKTTILYLSTSSGPGGAERLVNKLAVGFQNHSCRSLVCLFRPGWLQEQCENYGISTRVIPNKGLFDLVWLWQFLRLIHKEQVKLIHAHEFDAIVHGTLAAAIAGIPIVATIHGKNYYYEKAKRRLAYRLVSRYARLVAVSQNLKEFVVDRVGVAAHRITVVYNGVNDFPLVDSREVTQCRMALGISEKDSIIGVIGSLYPVKGHQYLIDALPAVLEQCPRAVLLIIGRGELESTLRDQVKRLKVERQVHFLGLRQDIPCLLNVMDAFVLPSISEGLSMAILEAMVAGKPVIATRVGGNPEIVIDRVTGILIPSQDSKALASSIVQLLSDREYAKQLGENGRNRIRERFKFSAMMKQYQNLYTSFQPK